MNTAPKEPTTVSAPTPLDTSPRNGRRFPAAAPEPVPGSPVTSDEGLHLLDLIVELQARVKELEDRPSARPARDDLNERIVEFLRRTGIRTNALTIAENLPGDDVTNGRVGSRLKTLADNAVIGRVKQDGRTALYFALPEQQ